MLKAQRRAEMVWNGNLARGNEAVTVDSGVVEALPMTWASRIEYPDGRDEPARVAGCSARALSLTLAEGGPPPERLRVSAICTLEEVDQKPKIMSMKLEVAERDAAGFEQAAQKAEQLCPVLGALHRNVALRLTEHLDV